DAIFLGPGEQTFPQFLDDFRAGRPLRRYASTSGRTLALPPPTRRRVAPPPRPAPAPARPRDRRPPPRRDLIRRRFYLVPNSIVVTRGGPQHCDFCYNDAFFDGDRSVYTTALDAGLAEHD